MPDDRDERLVVDISHNGSVYTIKLATFTVKDDQHQDFSDDERSGPPPLDERTHESTARTSETLLEWIAGRDSKNHDFWLRTVQSPQTVEVVFTIRDDALQHLPWELTGDGSGRLLIETGKSICRTGEVRFGGNPVPPAAPPYRVLVVVADSTEDAEQQVPGVEAVLRGLGTQSPCIWEATILRAPKRTDLEKELAALQPHIVHFVGHGEPSEDQSGYVLLLHTESESDRWTIDASSASKLTLPPSCQIVVLAHCTSIDTGQETARAFSGQGTPMVVSFRGRVPFGSLERFTSQFYESLVAGEPATTAAQLARHQTSYAADRPVVDNPYPVVTARVCPIRMSPIVHDREAAIRLLDDPGFRKAKLLVDHNPLRAQIAQVIAHRKPVTAIVGGRNSGKTAVTLASVVSALANGLAVAYVDLADDKLGKTDTVVTAIKKAVRKLPPPPPGPRATPTKQTVNAAWKALKPARRPAARYAALQGHLAGLGYPRLTVIVDHAGVIYDKKDFREQLLEPTDGAGSGVRFLLVEGEDPLGDLMSEEADQILRTPEVLRTQAVELATELIAKSWGEDQKSKLNHDTFRKEVLRWAMAECEVQKIDGRPTLSLAALMSQRDKWRNNLGPAGGAA